jgi:HPt (histidine-containing phosphotransfer) domain-containing protein
VESDVSVDESLFEMFRAEVEAHLATLNQGLLVLEQNPAQCELFEQLMRAAHSIKGAAKIVGRLLVVQIAHEMESCFVALREKRCTLTAGHVDLLLQGVDLLEIAAQATESMDDLQAKISAFVTRVSEFVQGKTVGRSVDPGTAPEPYSPNPLVGSDVRFRPLEALDAAWVAQYGGELARIVRERQVTIVMDLSLVRDVDPVGIGMLAALSQFEAGRSAPADVAFRLEHAAPQLQRALRAFGIGVHDTAVESES